MVTVPAVALPYREVAGRKQPDIGFGEQGLEGQRRVAGAEAALRRQVLAQPVDRSTRSAT